MAAAPDSTEDKAMMDNKKVFRAVMNQDLNKLKRDFPNFDYANTVDSLTLKETLDMTAIHWAAYLGNEEMVRWLLSKGVGKAMKNDVRLQRVLHNAIEAGDPITVRLLLDAGADRNVINITGYTAYQIASFIGNKYVLAALHNYVTPEEISSFSMPDGAGGQTTLPIEFVVPLRQLIIQINANPIRICLDIPSIFFIYDNHIIIDNALKIMRDRKMENHPRSYDVAMSFKLHYLSCILNEINVQSNLPYSSSKTEWFISQLLHTQFRWTFFDRIFESFPYINNNKFQKMLSNLKFRNNVVDSFDTAMLVFGYTRGVTKVEDPEGKAICNLCKEIGVSGKCKYCNKVSYCDSTCNFLHWKFHRQFCHVYESLDITEETDANDPQITMEHQVTPMASVIENSRVREVTATEDESTTEEEIETEDETETEEESVTKENTETVAEETAANEEMTTEEEMETEEETKIEEDTVTEEETATEKATVAEDTAAKEKMATEEAMGSSWKFLNTTLFSIVFGVVVGFILNNYFESYLRF